MLKIIFVLIGCALMTVQHVTADGPVINTPASLIQCQPVLLSWTNAIGKTYVSILPDKQISATPLVAFDPQDASTAGIKWVPNLEENTAVTLSISDDTGVKNYSNTIVVLKGGDQSCIKDGTSAAAAGSSSTTSSSAPAPAAAAAAAAAAIVPPVLVPVTPNATNTTNSSSASVPATISSSNSSASFIPVSKPDTAPKTMSSSSLTPVGKNNTTNTSATHKTPSNGAEGHDPATFISLAFTTFVVAAINFGFLSL